jgi:Ca2+-binding RTX toxin-like protein
MTGGTEGDIYYVDDAGDAVIEEPGHAGIDTVYTSITYTLSPGVEYLTLQGTADIHGTGNALDNSMAGNSGNNRLDGGDGNDALNGNAGSDLLIGGAGNDRLNGGAGDDTMIGGTGGDIYWVDDAGDIVVEDPGHAGIDTVYASISYALTGEAAGVEYLTQTGTGNIEATGNALNNSFVGNSGNNRLDGGDGNDTLKGNAGNDTLIGGAGNDALYGGSGSDTFLFAAGSGKDVIYDFNVAEDKLDLGDYGIDTAAGLTLIASNYGSALQVDFGDGNTVTIQNTQVNQIDDGWFV